LADESFRLSLLREGFWLHSLNYVRNICAHHGRLWNRECRIKPMIARAYKAELTPNARVYAQLVVMQILLAKIAPGEPLGDQAAGPPGRASGRAGRQHGLSCRLADAPHLGVCLPGQGRGRGRSIVRPGSREVAASGDVSSV
jgi:hypothetical protein